MSKKGRSSARSSQIGIGKHRLLHAPPAATDSLRKAAALPKGWRRRARHGPSDCAPCATQGMRSRKGSSSPAPKTSNQSSACAAARGDQAQAQVANAASRRLGDNRFQVLAIDEDEEGRQPPRMEETQSDSDRDEASPDLEEREDIDADHAADGSKLRGRRDGAAADDAGRAAIDISGPCPARAIGGERHALERADDCSSYAVTRGLGKLARARGVISGAMADPRAKAPKVVRCDSDASFGSALDQLLSKQGARPERAAQRGRQKRMMALAHGRRRRCCLTQACQMSIGAPRAGMQRR